MCLARKMPRRLFGEKLANPYKDIFLLQTGCFLSFLGVSCFCEGLRFQGRKDDFGALCGIFGASLFYSRLLFLVHTYILHVCAVRSRLVSDQFETGFGYMGVYPAVFLVGCAGVAEPVFKLRACRNILSGGF